MKRSIAAALAALLVASPALADPGRVAPPDGLGAGITALGLAAFLRGNHPPPPVVPAAPALVTPPPVVAAPAAAAAPTTYR
jgi:hypothetical protein